MNRSNDFMCNRVNLKITAQENLSFPKKGGWWQTQAVLKLFGGKGTTPFGMVLADRTDAEHIWILLVGLLDLSLARLNVVFLPVSIPEAYLTGIYFTDLWKLF